VAAHISEFAAAYVPRFFFPLTPGRSPPPRRAVVIDFEFRADPGENPLVWCLVTHDPETGETRRYWRDELLGMRQAPFDCGPDVAVIAYFASAEWNCFLALRWPLPAQPICLFAEFRCRTNRFLPRGVSEPRGLYAALERFGLEAGDVVRKDAMREVAKTATLTSWTDQTSRLLVEYCEDDVLRTAALYRRMLPEMCWPTARLHGLYTTVCAVQETNGIPVDVKTWRRLSTHWEALKARYIVETEAAYGYGFHVGGHFSRERFLGWLAVKGMAWPHTPNGIPRLDDRTFREMEEEHYPEIGPLRRLRSHISDLKMTGLAIGADGRNRTLTSPLRSATGRSQPSASKCILGPARWIRSLIKPPKGYAIVVFDWKAQEYAITAAESQDQRLIEAYLSGEPYLGFAKSAGFCPLDATPKTHPDLRERCKRLCLGTIYGMTERGAAHYLQIPVIDARELLRRHAEVYRVTWDWRREVIAAALSDEIMATRYGWLWRVVPYLTPSHVESPSTRTIANWKCQAGGAAMLHLATIMVVRAGVQLIATQHDSLWILTPLERLHDDIAIVESCMKRAGQAVTGIELGIDRKIIRSDRGPRRYTDDRGAATWTRTMAMLNGN
jgi:DNA polymerase I